LCSLSFFTFNRHEDIVKITHFFYYNKLKLFIMYTCIVRIVSIHGCHFLGSGFFGFWVLGIILNFPEPPFFGAQISQNPREFHRTQKKPACLRKRRTQHDYVVLCRSRIQRVCASAEHNTTTSCCVVSFTHSTINTTTSFCRWRGVDGPRLARSNFELK
jgi:hypothetical protein